jgi:hypothetical protein
MLRAVAERDSSPNLVGAADVLTGITIACRCIEPTKFEGTAFDITRRQGEQVSMNTTMESSGGENTSGQGVEASIPRELGRWCWGAFLWGGLWALGNKMWWFFALSLIPGVGLILRVYLAIHGQELAWRHKRWASVEHFHSVQRMWLIAWLCLCGTSFMIGLVGTLVMYALRLRH